MKVIQITITEHNDWEGETFSYILTVTHDELKLIREYIDKCKLDPDGSEYELEENTHYTEKEVLVFNEISDNSYMDRIGFYSLKPNTDFNDVTLFYKANGLLRI